RGSLKRIYDSLKPGTTEQQVADAFTTAYADAPFVCLTGGALPEIKHVAHTNFCDIGWKCVNARHAWARRTDGPAVTRRSAPARGRSVKKPALVLKLGGELLEQPRDVAAIAKAIARLSEQSSLVVVHGGGREIDAALNIAGIPKQQVDGLRVTDARTLDVVVSVLAGAINTRLVAAIRRAGAQPVGLTGVDAGVATMKRAAPVASVSGDRVD